MLRNRQNVRDPSEASTKISVHNEERDHKRNRILLFFVIS